MDHAGGLPQRPADAWLLQAAETRLQEAEGLLKERYPWLLPTFSTYALTISKSTPCMAPLHHSAWA